MKGFAVKIFFLLLLAAVNGFAQQKEIDSLRQCIKTAKDDTGKAKLQTKLAWLLINTGNYQEANDLATQALKLSIKGNWPGGQAIAYNDMGYVNLYSGQFQTSLDYFLKAVEIDKKYDLKSALAKDLGSIGGVYSNMGNYPKSLEYYLEGLRIDQSLNNKFGIAKFMSNIGIVYMQIKNYDKALEYFVKAKDDFLEIGGEREASPAIGNIGVIYEKTKKHALAIEYFERALKVAEETGDKYRMTLWNENKGAALEGLGDSVLNAGGAYSNGKLWFEKAVISYNKAYSLSNEIGDKMGIAVDIGFLGGVYIKLKKYKEAEDHLLRAKNLADSIGALELVVDQLICLDKLYTETDRPKLALENYKEYVTYKDSVFNEENTKKQTQLEMQYEFDKKEAAARLDQEKKDVIAIAEARKQKIILYSVSAGLMLLLILAIVIFRNLRLNQKKNRIISEQKEAVERQKEIVEAHQKEILDSIYYARRIQTALLPTEKYFEKKFSGLQKK